jgi:hypothetical protein
MVKIYEGKLAKMMQKLFFMTQRRESGQNIHNHAQADGGNFMRVTAEPLPSFFQRYPPF